MSEPDSLLDIVVHIILYVAVAALITCKIVGVI